MSDITDQLVAAYRDTEYRVFAEFGDFTLRIGVKSGELAALFKHSGRYSAAFVTAENPFSRVATPAENLTSQARLREDLTALGAKTIDGAGQGQDPTWPAENSILAIGISRTRACEMGRKYQQNAIVWIDADAIPELLLLR